MRKPYPDLLVVPVVVVVGIVVVVVVSSEVKIHSKSLHFLPSNEISVFSKCIYCLFSARFFFEVLEFFIKCYISIFILKKEKES